MGYRLILVDFYVVTFQGATALWYDKDLLYCLRDGVCHRDGCSEPRIFKKRFFSEEAFKSMALWSGSSCTSNRPRGLKRMTNLHRDKSLPQMEYSKYRLTAELVFLNYEPLHNLFSNFWTIRKTISRDNCRKLICNPESILRIHFLTLLVGAVKQPDSFAVRHADRFYCIQFQYLSTSYHL